MDATQFSPGHVQVTRPLGATGEQDGVELFAQVFHRHVAAHMRIRQELNALGRHLLHASVDEVLLHFKIRNAVTQQASDAVVLFEQGDPVAGARQLLRRRKPRGTRADYRHALAGPRCRRLGVNPALVEGVIDDGFLDLLDGYRGFVDAEHARGLARGGADAAGELGKIVGGVQHADGFAPVAAVNQIIPIGNDVVQRAAGVAEGHAAIHAACALFADFLFGEIEIDLEPVVDTFRNGAPRWRLAREFHEAGVFTHAPPAVRIR